MTEWIVSSGVLIVVVALMRQMFKGRLSLRLQYALWAMVLIRLLVPVSFGQSKLSVLNAVEERQTAQITVDIPPSRVDYVPPQLAPAAPDPALPAEEREEQDRQNVQQWQNQMDAAWEQYKAENTKEVTVSVPEILRIVWYAGMAAMALCLLWSNLSFRLRLRRSRRPLEGADCPLPVYVTRAVETPCLFGLPRPAVYVTPEVAGDELAMGHVLAHEYTHYRHGDHIWSVLRCICLVLHWYNPLVWLAASLSRRDGELACDEGTLRRIGEGERLAYGRTLIGLTCARRGGLLRTATTMTGSKGSIKERITLIAKKPKMAAYTLIAVLLIAVLAVGCTFTGAREDAAEPPAAGESVTPEVDGSASGWPKVLEERSLDVNGDGKADTVRVLGMWYPIYNEDGQPDYSGSYQYPALEVTVDGRACIYQMEEAGMWGGVLYPITDAGGNMVLILANDIGGTGAGAVRIAALRYHGGELNPLPVPAMEAYSFNQGFDAEIRYADDYQVEITVPSTEFSALVSLPEDAAVRSGYDQEGKVVVPDARGEIDGICSVRPVTVDGTEGLELAQYIWGWAHSDALGYLCSVITWDTDGWVLLSQRADPI